MCNENLLHCFMVRAIGMRLCANVLIKSRASNTCNLPLFVFTIKFHLNSLLIYVLTFLSEYKSWLPPSSCSAALDLVVAAALLEKKKIFNQNQEIITWNLTLSISLVAKDPQTESAQRRCIIIIIIIMHYHLVLPCNIGTCSPAKSLGAHISLDHTERTAPDPL